MYCGKCGKEIPDIANVCGYCGDRVNKIEDNAVQKIEHENSDRLDSAVAQQRFGSKVEGPKGGTTSLWIILIWGISWGFGYIWDSPAHLLILLFKDLTGFSLTSYFYYMFDISLYFSMGILVGTIQWLYLRKIGNFPSNWILMTAIGVTMSDVILRRFYTSILLHAIIAGLSLGVCQWIVLRRHVERGSLWLLINIATAFLVLSLPKFGSILSGVIFQLIFGLLTGIGIFMLLKTNLKNSEPNA